MEISEGLAQRNDAMCDYSLEHVESRPAKVGDQLVSTLFSNSIARGFSEYHGNSQVAVCLLPGTELAFERNVEADSVMGWFGKKNIGEKTARFRRINLDHPYAHHDALEFPSGRIVELTKLIPGQRATVLQLPVAVSASTEPKPEAEQEPAPQGKTEAAPQGDPAKPAETTAQPAA
jgi:hypothetical protein